MDKPLISVCLITYNHFNYIGLAIDSVLSQKLDVPWELIIADDCSTDGTAGIVSAYKEKYPDLIRLLDHGKNLGPGLNFVNLINSARGKYIAYLEGDDYWIDDLKLQKQYKFLEENTGLSICYHQVKWIDSVGNDFAWQDIKPGTPTNGSDPAVSNMHDLLKKGWFMRSCSLFFQKITIPNGFDKLMSGDYALHVLIADKGNIGFIKQMMGVYRIHDKSASNVDLTHIGVEKKREIFRREVDTLKWLDEKTHHKYTNGLMRRGAVLSCDYLLIVAKTKSHLFLEELRYALTNIGYRRVIKELLKFAFWIIPLGLIGITKKRI